MNKKLNINTSKGFYDDSDFNVELLHQELPEDLNLAILGSMKKYVQPDFRSVAAKYSVAFVFAGLVSLFLCPQKNFGFLESYPLFFHVFHTNLILCGLYCGLFFATLTHVSSLLVLNNFERLVIRNKLWFLPHLWFAAFFAIFMALGDEFYNFNLNYNFSWVFSVIFLIWLIQKIKLFESYKSH